MGIQKRWKEFRPLPEDIAERIKRLTHQHFSEKGVISQELFQKMKGLGGVRNILIHEYREIDLDLIY